MSYFAKALTGATIHSVFVDSEVTYIMLTNGTQVTVKGLVVVQPANLPPQTAAPSVSAAV